MRREPGAIWGYRWRWHKAILDQERFRTFRAPEGKEMDSVPLSDIIRAEAVLLVSSKAPVIPREAFAEVPPEVASPKGLLIILRRGQEILLCLQSEEERDRWHAALNGALNGRVRFAAQEAAAAAEVPRVTQAPAAAVPPEALNSKGKGKGKGPPTGAAKAPPRGIGPGKTPAKAMEPKVVPKIHGLVEVSKKAQEDVASTIFGARGATPRHEVKLDAFVAEKEQQGPAGPRRTTTSEQGTRLLSDDVAQAVAVAVQRADVAAIAAAAAALDPKLADMNKTLQLDAAEVLFRALAGRPDRDPLGLIRNYINAGGDGTKLRRIESSLLPLAVVPRAVPRLRLLLLEASLEERLSAARKQLELMVSAGRKIEQCRLLRDIVRIIQDSMDWNVGRTAAGAARPVFQVGEQLDRLKTIRPPITLRGKVFAGYSYIHWMAEELIWHWGRCVNTDPFLEEVPDLHISAKVDPTLALDELKQVQAGLRLASLELQDHAVHYCSKTDAPEDTVEKEAEKEDSSDDGENDETDAQGDEQDIEEATSEPEKGDEGEEVEIEGPGFAPVKTFGPQTFDITSRGRHRNKAQGGMARETFDLDDAACGRPTELLNPGLEVADLRRRGPVPASAWEAGKLPTDIESLRLRFYRSGTFAFAGRQAATPSSSSSAAVPRASPSARPPQMAHQRDSNVAGEGFIWLLLPHRTRRPTWQRCWADVRSRHLVIRQVLKGRLARESAVPLPGTEVLPLESLYASEISRWLASLQVVGFELRQVKPKCSTLAINGVAAADERSPPIIICVESGAAARRWEQLLATESSQPGAGWLPCIQGRRSRPSPYWCLVSEEVRTLLCFKDSIDYAEGRGPRHVVHLAQATVRAVSPEAPNALVGNAAKQMKAYYPHAFEVEEPRGAGMLMFTASTTIAFGVQTQDDLGRWLIVVQTLCRSGALMQRFGEVHDISGRDSDAVRGSGQDDGDKDGRRSYAQDPDASEDEDDPFARLARLRPSFGKALKEAAEAAAKAAAKDAKECGAAEPVAEAIETCEPSLPLPMLTEPVAQEAVVAEALMLESVEEAAAAGAEADAPALPADSRLRRRSSSSDSSGLTISEVTDDSAGFETESVFSGSMLSKNGDRSRADPDEDNEAEDPGRTVDALMRLERLQKRLRTEASRLERQLQESEYAAQTTLSFFGETAPQGKALAALQVFLGQISSFARDFAAAVRMVREQEQRRSKEGRRASVPGRSSTVSRAVAGEAMPRTLNGAGAVEQPVAPPPRWPQVQLRKIPSDVPLAPR